MRFLILILTLISGVVSRAGAAELPNLKTSDNHHFIVTADGKPFFYLGDTAWELFHRLDRRTQTRTSRNVLSRASMSFSRWRLPNSTATRFLTLTAIFH